MPHRWVALHVLCAFERLSEYRGVSTSTGGVGGDVTIGIHETFGVVLVRAVGGGVPLEFPREGDGGVVFSLVHGRELSGDGGNDDVSV